MHVLIDHFKPLEDSSDTLDTVKLYQLATWHELDEIELGDVPAVTKTDADREAASQMLKVTLDKLPDTLRSSVKLISDEYERQDTPEAKFIKAIDKLEPLVHSFDPRSKPNQHDLKITTAASLNVKEKYIANYPYIKLFSDTLHTVMDREGYFYSGSD